jgi:hypothetical protein
VKLYKNTHSRKTRPFILAEVVIALSLLMICVLPLTSYPLNIREKQISLFKEMELEREKERLFRDLLENLSFYLGGDLKPLQTFYNKEFEITVGDKKFKYLAIWRLKVRKKNDANFGLLRAYLSIHSKDKQLRKKTKTHTNETLFEYLIEINDPASQREEYGSN